MKYLNQAPKEFAAQSAAFKKKHGSVDDLHRLGWEAQPKYDGVFCMINTTTEQALSRTLEEFKSVDHLVQQAVVAFGPGHMVFMELYKGNTPHKDINGAVRRQYAQPDLIGVVFDTVPTSAYEDGYCDAPYHQRLDRVYVAVVDAPGLIAVDTLDVGGSVSELAEKYHNSKDNAYDGVILRDPDAPWTAGASKQGEVIKVKFVMSLDLIVTGQHAEKRATKLGGYLTVVYNGVPSDVGSGLTQDMLQGILANQPGSWPFGAEDYRGHIAEVECLGLTPAGKLREPRLKGLRFDTTEEECK